MSLQDTKPNHEFLFVLCPPFSGSTILWQLLATSPHSSALPVEGQFVKEVSSIMRSNPWNPAKQLPWSEIRSVWENYWDKQKPILLEKSPPNLIRAQQIQQAFQPTSFVCMVRNPYAFCEGYHRRAGKPGMVKSAKFWVKTAKKQIANFNTLERAIFFSYEDLTTNPERICDLLLEFMPALESLDPQREFTSVSVHGLQHKSIVDFNRAKINLLTRHDIEEINSVIFAEPELMEELGYEYIHGSIHHTLAHISAKADTLRRRIVRRVMRESDNTRI